MTDTDNRNIVWVAGENSGDYLASLVFPALKNNYSNTPFFGIGGERMVQAGLNPWYSSSELSVRGYLEVIRHLPRILKIRSNTIQRSIAESPLAYIGVDAPDFNLGIEEKLRLQGIPVIHMVAPAIWAWRANRVHQIRRSVDHLLLVFPFEEELFKNLNIPATYIGHPLASVIPMEPDTPGAREKLKLNAYGPVVAVLPGSRKDEIHWCGPRFLGACDLILKSEPHTQFVIPAAEGARRKEIESLLQQFPAVREASILTDGGSHLALEASDAVLVASGTATLEAALYKKPLVVGYAMPAISAMLILSKGSTKWISLPNILAQKGLVPECVQMFCTPQILASHVLHALEPRRREYLEPIFTQMHESLLRNTGELAAQAIESVINKKYS
ncbi:MAG: lipid-A-disaccharide synthase [Burkholderiaceae bacterium]|nr:lipid-A-disaccharide synthase [Burkholderiaceae bacterium]